MSRLGRVVGTTPGLKNGKGGWKRRLGGRGALGGLGRLGGLGQWSGWRWESFAILNPQFADCL